MSYQGSPLNEYDLCNQASVNVAHASGPADVNTLLLSYPTAVNHTIKPPVGLTKKVPHGNGNLRASLRFILNHATDATGKKAQCNIWTWSDGGNGGLLLMNLTVEGGTGDLTTTPRTVTPITLGATDWAFGDTITETAMNLEDWYYRGAAGGNGILELTFDLYDASEIMVDFDCNVDGSNVAADAIALVKFW